VAVVVFEVLPKIALVASCLINFNIIPAIANPAIKILPRKIPINHTW
jgi:hypothetical protein